MSRNPFLEPYHDIARLRERALQVLGLECDTGAAEVRAAFHRLAREHHPDVGGNSQRFVRIVNAYLVLTKPDPRGFLLDEEGDGRLDVPESAADYRRWWLNRFAP